MHELTCLVLAGLAACRTDERLARSRSQRGVIHPLQSGCQRSATCLAPSERTRLVSGLAGVVGRLRVEMDLALDSLAV